MDEPASPPAPPIGAPLRGLRTLALPLALLAATSAALLIPDGSTDQAAGIQPAPRPMASPPHPEPALAPPPHRSKAERFEERSAAAGALQPGADPFSPSRESGADAAEQAGIELLVVDGRSRGPVPGARVELYVTGEDREWVVVETADEEGRVRREVPEGFLCATAWAGGFVGGPVEIEVGRNAPAALVVEMRAARAVEGQVYDAFSGSPIEGARIRFWTFAEGDVVTTGADGRFRHPRFPAHTIGQQVRVEAEGYGPAVRYLELAPDGSWELLAPSEGAEGASGPRAPARVDVALVPQLRVRGRVFDACGRPLPDARVSVEGYYHVLPSVASSDARAGFTDGDGRFELGGLRSDVSHTLLVQAQGHARELLDIPPSSTASPVEIDVLLEREALLSGVVIDADGVPVEGIEVGLKTHRREVGGPDPRHPLDARARIQGRSFSVQTGRFGAFLFEGLAPDEYELSVQRDRGALVRRDVSLDVAQVLDGLRVDLPATALILSGEVRDDRGPVAGATVEVERFGPAGRVTTDRHGRFRIAGLDDLATYDLIVELEGPDPRGVRRGQVEVWAWEQPVLRLEPGIHGPLLADRRAR